MGSSLKSENQSFWRLLGTAWYFAWGDLKTRYRRSALGPLWLVLGTGIGVVGLGYVWATLLNMDADQFVPLLTVGLVVWQLVSACLTESSNVLYRHAKVIRNLRVSFLLFPLQLLMKHFLYFLHNLIVVVAVFIVFQVPLSWVQLMAIPGLLIVLGNMLWVITFIGIFAARYRDVEALIASIMPLLFFLSPVLYKPSNLGVKSQLAWLNPLTYLITVIRDPLQGNMPPLFVYGVSLAMLLIGSLVTWRFLISKQNRIAFWM